MDEEGLDTAVTLSPTFIVGQLFYVDPPAFNDVFAQADLMSPLGKLSSHFQLLQCCPFSVM